MSAELVKAAAQKMLKAVDHTRSEMVRIRTGKANPALLDGLRVDYYGSPTPLKQIANVGAPEARLLVVQPFDPNSIAAIEKAIQSSDLGLNPQNDGHVIRVPIPILTAERREELIKVVRRFAEEGRIAVRNVRREANDQLKQAEKASEISEDESHRLQDLVQKETDDHISKIDELLKNREAEIREN